MERLRTNKHWLFISDVDDTLLGDEAGLTQLASALQRVANQPVIVYNSSRPCSSLRKTLASTPSLPIPDFLAGALGTEIELGISEKRLTEYSQELTPGWKRDQIVAMIREMGLEMHIPEYQTDLKISCNAPDASTEKQLATKIERAGLKAKVIFSGGKNLDIIPNRAGKGTVAEYLQKQLQILSSHVIVSGDSGNDREMFIHPYKGIIVGNASPELKRLQGDLIYQARANYALGVLEGLQFWQML